MPTAVRSSTARSPRRPTRRSEPTTDGKARRSPRATVPPRKPGPLAQLVEQGTLNPKVEGSNPSRPISQIASIGWDHNSSATWRGGVPESRYGSGSSATTYARNWARTYEGRRAGASEPRPIREYDRDLQLHVLHLLGRRRLSEIEQRDLETLARHLGVMRRDPVALAARGARAGRVVAEHGVGAVLAV